MTNQEKTMFPLALARAVSVVFHPLFVPLYGLVIIFAAPTLFAHIPFAVKKLLFLIVLTNNVFVPLAMLPFFINRGIISSYHISERRERIIPMALVSVLYSVTSFIIFRYQIPGLLKAFIFSASLLSVILTLVTYFWKISLHAAGAGALSAVVAILWIRMSSPLPGYLIAVVLASGLILSSRLKMNSHSPAEVWSGYLSGLICTFAFIALF